MADAKEQALLRGLRAWDAAWAAEDVSSLRKVLAPGATLRAEGVLLEKDVHGAGAIAELHSRYFDRWRYTHKEIAHAVNADTGSVFAFWQDSDVARKGGEAGAAAAPDSSIVGAWKLALTADGTAAQDIFFLRQLHREEAEHKLVDPGAAAHGGVDPSLFAGEPLGGDVPGARAAMRRAAERYSEMWQGSSPGPIAEEVLAENFEEADLTRGSGLRGRPDFVAMINKMADAHSGWVSDSSELDIGVAEARSVAFVHWASSGSFGRDGPTAKISGFSLLVFDPREPGRIRRAAGFRQPSPQERQKLLRPGAFAHAAPAAEA